MNRNGQRYQEAVEQGFDEEFEALRKAQSEGRTGVQYKIEDDPWYNPSNPPKNHFSDVV